ncbi:protein NRDE2 homolog [Anoplophora glabripennis]|uniref:protein NRDE2 homolog n=1 Tax=Anoplophora glabripennis TaxID=217634 RepID=UPI0008744754|nr:protein NRDE2 homolog [Anoplophora glabripennis]
MSLFPAYANEDTVTEQEHTEKQWLQNSSFRENLSLPNVSAVSLSKFNDSTTSTEDEQTSVEHKRKHKTKKQKVKKVRQLADTSKKLSDNFVVDTKRIKEYLTVPTISRPSAPRYRVLYKQNFARKTRKQKYKRYYQIMFEKNVDKSNSEEDTPLTVKNLDKSEHNSKDENFTGFKQEEELTQKTGYFNRYLGENPNDVQVWLEYIQFQDTIYQFEKSYRKGSIAKAQRVLAERKLAILDKALSLNSSCEQLLRERLKIAVSAYPADELQVYLQNLVEKDKSNIILWQGYIEATQCSMSHCNTPAVLSLYSKCLSTLHQLRRNTSLEKHLLEENILRMLYQCGLFLKQAGLFEQLWTLLRLYLELNLSPNDKKKFNIASGFDEKHLVELEEVVFNSQLPLHELWLRTEKLRESCHWLPYLEDEVCEDPQRIVFTEDVAELIHPITMPENIFKLTATVFSLLKIPLLPCRHTTMQELGLDYVPWSLDSIEPLLSVFLPLYPIDITNENLLNDSKLTVGPQYLKVLPGQEEYLKFILIVMQNSADCLTGDDKFAVTVWWFRFQRLLIIMEKLKRFKIGEQFKKQMKKNMKSLMKQEGNRQNEIFYVEYALIEYEFGNIDACVNILKTTVSTNKNAVIATKNWDNPQVTQCHLYRILVQMTLILDGDPNENKTVALKYLCELAQQKRVDVVTKDLLQEVEVRYKLLTWQILHNDFSKLPTLFHFLPDFLTDWLICHGWFIYLTKGPIECGVFIEKSLKSLEEKDQNIAWQKEVLYEFYVAILFKYCLSQPGCGVFKILDDVLYKAIKEYPNNLFLLSVLAKEQSLVFSLGQPWWKIQDMLLKSGRAFSIFFSIIISGQQIFQLEEMCTDTITGERYSINTNIKNRVLALFKKITKAEMCTRRCGLVWRLYLQFVQKYFSLGICRNVYYSAVEECPWLKALYLDAAIYIPAELSQIQDLIIEKQLRLHVTPEELDVLRS